MKEGFLTDLPAGSSPLQRHTKSLRGGAKGPGQTILLWSNRAKLGEGFFFFFAFFLSDLKADVDDRKYWREKCVCQLRGGSVLLHCREPLCFGAAAQRKV